MTLVGLRSQNHPQQTAKRGALVAVDDRATPPEAFDPFNARFHFTVDVAADETNAKCDRFFSIETNGLAQSWAGERVWCNPPYSDIKSWVDKAWLEWAAGAEVIVMLLPANRTEQRWWQELVEPFRDRAGSLLRVEFLPGRIRFIRPPAQAVTPNDRPPFGSCLLIWAGPGSAERLAA